MFAFPRLALFVTLSVLLAACGTTKPPKSGVSRLAAETERLRSQCRARDGAFLPSGANTGRPAIDYVCDIRGSAFVRDRKEP